MLGILRFIAPSALERHQRKSLRHSSPVRCTVPDLPPEILEEIFLHCIPPGEQGSFSTCDAPLLLIQICCEWREVALSAPSLWSRLPPLEAHPVDGHLKLLKLYLEKSAKKALSITFGLSWGPGDAPLPPLIIPYLSQSQDLSIVSYCGVPNQEPRTTHDHFPLLKNLELLNLSLRDAALENQPTVLGLEGMRFPWAQLTRLTIQFHSTTEALVLLRNCSSLEVFHLTSAWDDRVETLPTPPEPKTVHYRLRTITFEDISGTDLFVGFAGLLGCLVTPALSALTFIRSEDIRQTGRHAMWSILSFIRDSSAELASLALRGIECSLHYLIYLSTLIPMVTELDLCGIHLDSFQVLTIKAESPHGILFPRLERLVVRDPASFNAKLCLDMFHSRLYLAPNMTIIESMSRLQHAELHLQQTKFIHHTGISCFYWQESNFTIIVRCLRGVYSRTAGFNTKTLRGAVSCISLRPVSPDAVSRPTVARKLRRR
ncbi:hypothetical protein BD779DRAFT_689961 [Infundibulicybe gibba]|nr:hypothetical protein BD779DRAFT_689961 [Infundibulicybe gibba]